MGFFWHFISFFNAPMPLKERNPLAVRILCSDSCYMTKRCSLFSSLFVLEQKDSSIPFMLLHGRRPSFVFCFFSFTFYLWQKSIILSVNIKHTYAYMNISHTYKLRAFINHNQEPLAYKHATLKNSQY